ncbi:MAG: hypothetical protein KGS44_14725 [Alphaproteobacteria bacterium]|nr:hypothetical protein [Alphaproteobacteria bacterium]
MSLTLLSRVFALRHINHILETRMSSGGRRVYAVGGERAKARFIRWRSLRSLDAQRSLEAILAAFQGEMVDDPSGAFGRAHALVAAAKLAYKRGGGMLRGLHLNPSGDTLHARVRDEAVRTEAAAMLGEVFAQHLAGPRFAVAILVSIRPAPKGALALLRLGALQDGLDRIAHRLALTAAIAFAPVAAALSFGARADLDAATKRPNRDMREGDLIIVAPVWEDALGGASRQAADDVRKEAAFALSANVQRSCGDEIGARSGPQCPMDGYARQRTPPEAASPAVPPAETILVYRVAFNAYRAFSFAQLDVADPGGEEVRSAEALRFFSRQPMTALERGGPAETPPAWLRILTVESMRAPDPDLGGASGYQYHFIIRVIIQAELRAETRSASLPKQEHRSVAPVDSASPTGSNGRGVDPGLLILDDPCDRMKTAANDRFGLAHEGQRTRGASQGPLEQGNKSSPALASPPLTKRQENPRAASHGSEDRLLSADRENGLLSNANGRVGGSCTPTRLGRASRDGLVPNSVDGAGPVWIGRAWRAMPDLASDLLGEQDRLTGPCAGMEAEARPFSDVFATLMVDADEAWHDDGAESFRMGLRWMLGQGEAETVQKPQRPQGVAPILLERAH